jgi:CRP/FNR family transcriptional regulator
MKLTEELLKNIPVFSELTSTELSLLQKFSKLESYKENQILFYEGDESLKLYILLEGKIDIFKTNSKGKEIKLKQFLPFSFIAEVSNYNHIQFPASAKFITDSTVLAIDYAKFEENLLYHKNIAPIIIKSMASKVLDLEKLISENLTMDATQRIAKFIYENDSMFLNQKHHIIANKLNITPVTFSRILKKFREQYIISSTNHILDKELLKKCFLNICK